MGVEAKIEVLMVDNPITGEHNDSLMGNYVWSCVNYAEAQPELMTPLTWSIVSMVWNDQKTLPGYISDGNIGGHMYRNLTVTAHVYRVLGMKKRLAEFTREFFGTEGLSDEKIGQYLAPLPGVTIFNVLPNILRIRLRWVISQRKTTAFLKGNPGWCREMEQTIRQTTNGRVLASLFANDIKPYLLKAFCLALAVGARYGERVGPLRQETEKLAGPGETDKLFSSINRPDDLLESLGPVVGLARVARGEISREVYLEKWGHRMAAELEVSVPRPLEDPGWLDCQIEEYNKAPYDADALLETRRNEFDNLREKFQNRYPGKAKSILNRIDKAAEDGRLREAIRSEYARIFCILHLWCLRAGELTGTGNDVFFLSMDELHARLSGQEAPIVYIPIRRQTYEKYKKLPPYPRVIRGRFDPLKWAEDPNRTTDIFNSHILPSEIETKAFGNNIIEGIPVSAGIVEGLVRRLDSPEEGDKLQKGEILVTSLTNIGWTLIFPRAGGVVTDIGASLSHAAIVARELGIPAVVGCGNATMRLHTGDRVRVDGAQGKVEILVNNV
jgi:phosphohistidine swiveling domain-containing protein